MSKRATDCFAENAMVAFAIYCDENGLSREQRQDLAAMLYDSYLDSIPEDVS